MRGAQPAKLHIRAVADSRFNGCRRRALIFSGARLFDVQILGTSVSAGQALSAWFSAGRTSAAGIPAGGGQRCRQIVKRALKRSLAVNAGDFFKTRFSQADRKAPRLLRHGRRTNGRIRGGAEFAPCAVIRADVARPRLPNAQNTAQTAEKNVFYRYKPNHGVLSDAAVRLIKRARLYGAVPDYFRGFVSKKLINDKAERFFDMKFLRIKN